MNDNARHYEQGKLHATRIKSEHKRKKCAKIRNNCAIRPKLKAGLHDTLLFLQRASPSGPEWPNQDSICRLKHWTELLENGNIGPT
jgi:hypothetical protein